MKAIDKTRRFDINLKEPYAIHYTAVATSKARVLEMLEEELSTHDAYKVEDFEIDDWGKATDQMGNYLEESFTVEIE